MREGKLERDTEREPERVLATGNGKLFGQSRRHKCCQSLFSRKTEAKKTAAAAAPKIRERERAKVRESKLS